MKGKIWLDLLKTYFRRSLNCHQTWTLRLKGHILFQGKRIYFDQDYSPDLQQKRMRVREVIKQLKKMDIQARCLYPAQLRVKLNTGEKTFASLTSAALLLKELGPPPQ